MRNFSIGLALFSIFCWVALGGALGPYDGAERFFHLAIATALVAVAACLVAKWSGAVLAIAVFAISVVATVMTTAALVGALLPGFSVYFLAVAGTTSNIAIIVHALDLHPKA